MFRSPPCPRVTWWASLAYSSLNPPYTDSVPLRIAHFVQPLAPKLIYCRHLFGVANLALDVFAKRRDIKAAQHGGAGVGQVDLVVDIDTHKILAERYLAALFA